MTNLEFKIEEIKPIAELLTKVREDQLVIDQKSFVGNELIIRIRDKESADLKKVTINYKGVLDVVDDFEPILKDNETEFEWLQFSAPAPEKDKVYRSFFDKIMVRAQRMKKALTPQYI